VLVCLRLLAPPAQAAGNDLTEVRPTEAVQPGTWGAPKDSDPIAAASADRSVSGFGKVDTSDVVDDDMAEWRRQREEERKQQDAEVEAKMQMWLQQAAEKKSQGGQ